MTHVTKVLSALNEGDPRAGEQLLPLVYDELRRLAARRIQQEKPGQTLQATALVHEAYLRLLDEGGGQDWNGRGHFFAAAAEAMRRILVDHARRKRRTKHGGDRKRVGLDTVVLPVEDRFHDLIALDEALTLLAAREPRKAEVVKLRYFAGLTNEEVAECLEIGTMTAKRDWTVARAWLYAALSDAGGATEEAPGARPEKSAPE